MDKGERFTLHAASAAEATITTVSGGKLFNDSQFKLVSALYFQIAQKLTNGAVADVVSLHNVHAGAGDNDKLGHTFAVADESTAGAVGGQRQHDFAR